MMGDPSKLSVIRKAAALARARPTQANPAFDLLSQFQRYVSLEKKWEVYLQQIKKKAKAEGKTCHAKTMLSLEKPL